MTISLNPIEMSFLEAEWSDVRNNFADDLHVAAYIYSFHLCTQPWSNMGPQKLFNYHMFRSWDVM